jgi:diamine N-acetyltransferase
MQYKGIQLRALEPEDLHLLYEWENNVRYWSVSNTITPFSKYILKLYIENSHKSIYETGQLRLMIDHLEDNVTIGTIDVFEFDPFHKRAGIGILIANEAYRKKGYASTALEFLTGYCFKTLHLHQLFANIISSNTESIELFTKQGFKAIGTKKDWILSETGFVDVIMYQLLND